LVRAHSGKQTVKGRYASEEVRSLVEHDAFRAGRHSGIRHFASRGQSFANEALKNLRRPNCRHLRSLADPQYLFLHLCNAFEAEFNSEITPCDHDAYRLAPRRLHDNLGKIPHRSRGLYLGDESKTVPVRPACGELVLQGRNVVGSLHE
jgi:hypothetical protein